MGLSAHANGLLSAALHQTKTMEFLVLRKEYSIDKGLFVGS